MATLKISDLSVGDWVAVETDDLTTEHGDFATAFVKHGDIARVFVKKVLKPICVQSILGEDKFVCGRASHLDDEKTYATLKEYLHPIPITAEILEANGLYRHEADADNPKRVVMSNSCILARTYEDVDWWRVLIYDEEELSAELFNGIVYSVHQLQHALRLAGVEKEIVMPNK